jgi:hypothetical protein
MANSDKNILITPNIGSSSADPKIEFKGADSSTGPSTITAVVYPTNSGTLSFEGSAGQLFSITNNLTSGSIFAVNDVSGIPSIDVNADGTISLGAYGGNIGVGTISAPSKLTVQGQIQSTSDALISGLTVGKGTGSVSTNTALGYQALYSNTTGSNNTATGYTALYSNTTGQYNVANGYYALYSNTIGSNNTSNGYRALFSNTTGIQNTATGVNALYYNTTGQYNIATGVNALLSNTTGSSNTANGVSSLTSNTTGTQNTATGAWALYGNTTGNANTANGYQALYSNTTGIKNTATGLFALISNTTGFDNTANGYNALGNATTGKANTATGSLALYANTTGTSNTATGFAALYGTTTGSYNAANGYNAGSSNTTGSNNTFLGNAAVNTAGGATASNTIVLGNSSVTTLRCQTATISALSDARDKKDVINIPLGLNFLNDLRPVKFTWNQRDRGRIDLPDSGFIAQEALETVMNYDADWFGLVDHQNPEHFEISPGKLIPVLVRAVQELSQQNQELKALIDSIVEKT